MGVTEIFERILPGAAFAALLLWASVADLRTMRIPNVLCALFLVPATVRMLFGSLTPLSAAFGLLVTALPLILISLLRPQAMFGGGDIKLMSAAGLTLGFVRADILILLSCLFLLCVWAVFRLRGRLRPGQRLPFAPFIAAAGIIAYFC